VVAEAWSEQHQLAIEHARAYLRRFGEDGEIYTWLGVGWWSQGKTTEARLCFERALELFGDDLSDVYVVVFTANLYQQLGARGPMHALGERWIAILESKLSAFPDNFRIRAWLAGLYASLGRRADVEKTVDQYLAQVAAVGQSRDGAMFSLPYFLMRVGSIDRAEAVCGVVMRKDLAVPPVLEKVWIDGISGAQREVLLANPALQAYRNATRRRVAELAARY